MYALTLNIRAVARPSIVAYLGNEILLPDAGPLGLRRRPLIIWGAWCKSKKKKTIGGTAKKKIINRGCPKKKNSTERVAIAVDMCRRKKNFVWRVAGKKKILFAEICTMPPQMINGRPLNKEGSIHSCDAQICSQLLCIIHLPVRLFVFVTHKKTPGR